MGEQKMGNEVQKMILESGMTPVVDAALNQSIGDAEALVRLDNGGDDSLIKDYDNPDPRIRIEIASDDPRSPDAIEIGTGKKIPGVPLANEVVTSDGKTVVDGKSLEFGEFTRIDQAVLSPDGKMIFVRGIATPDPHLLDDGGPFGTHLVNNLPEETTDNPYNMWKRKAVLLARPIDSEQRPGMWTLNEHDSVVFATNDDGSSEALVLSTHNGEPGVVGPTSTYSDAGITHLNLDRFRYESAEPDGRRTKSARIRREAGSPDPIIMTGENSMLGNTNTGYFRQILENSRVGSLTDDQIQKSVADYIISRTPDFLGNEGELRVVVNGDGRQVAFGLEEYMLLRPEGGAGIYKTINNVYLYDTKAHQLRRISAFDHPNHKESNITDVELAGVMPDGQFVVSYVRTYGDNPWNKGRIGLGGLGVVSVNEKGETTVDRIGLETSGDIIPTNTQYVLQTAKGFELWGHDQLQGRGNKLLKTISFGQIRQLVKPSQEPTPQPTNQ